MITSLRLQNFRSYRDSTFDFVPEVNIIVGPNASGKTNILEAVLVLAHGQSYRGRDVELIKNQAPWSRIDSFVNGLPRGVKLERQTASAIKSFVIDDKEIKHLQSNSKLPVVYFEPDHLAAFTRGPEQRRNYFDDLLERTSPNYKTSLASYKRTLSQRNALLKRPSREVVQQVFAWDVRLGETGARIAEEREKLIKKINLKLSGTYSKIARSKNKLIINYQPMFPINRYGSAMVSGLSTRLNQDIERGFTSVGPHREDFLPQINNKPMEEVASRGEMRSLLLALKTIELELVRDTGGQPALLLLDDVFSELDSQRRQALVNLIKDYQTILTTTDADAIVDYFSPNYKIINLD